jgi:uncharacterized protein (DUF608 family)
MKQTVWNRRDFLKAAGIAGAAANTEVLAVAQHAASHTSNKAKPTRTDPHTPIKYDNESLSRVAYPLGGIGAGMICLEGTGALSNVSIRNRPDLFNEPVVFAAIAVKGSKPSARVLEGPVPAWKIFGMPNSGLGEGEHTYGLPRFRNASFSASFPFGTVALNDPEMPVTVGITGWSPFTPGDADNSSLPVVALEYQFTNTTAQPVDAVFSFNAKNFLPATGPNQQPQAIRTIGGGFLLWSGAFENKPWEEASLAVTTSEPGAMVNHAWFRGGWFDALTMAWNDVVSAAAFDRAPVTDDKQPSPGATLFIPITLAPKERRTITLRISWYAPQTHLRIAAQGAPNEGQMEQEIAAGETTYRPWYGDRFANIEAVSTYWRDHYADLRARTKTFTDAFYNSTLPPEVIDAVACNLSILKSPTVLRQADGKFWAWEGTGDESGSCAGSCTHVWNYAQAVSHLFPQLERSLRETEFGPDQDEHGHQQFRAALPIRPVANHFHAAADGQPGGILKVYREWRISGDTEWLRSLWPKVKLSLDYCIETWDPKHKGWLEEPHHNTYDIEFWGPTGMCTSIYLGALHAAALMGATLNDGAESVSLYQTLYNAGRRRMETELYNGEYFIQKIEWKNLRAPNPADFRSFGGQYSPEARELLEKEGPKYQYGNGCLSDGVIGAWFAFACGLDSDPDAGGPILDAEKVTSHLRSVHRYNLKQDLSHHADPQRPGFALGAEGGLLLCTWPHGGALSLPFVYSNEVWTGIEYQAASHMIASGLVPEGLQVVRTVAARYDGRVRNPFDQYECGHWYARAMSSYALLQAFSGARYDAVTRTLHIKPVVSGDFRSFLSTATGFGTVGVKDGKPFLEVASGTIPFQKIEYVSA